MLALEIRFEHPKFHPKLASLVFLEFLNDLHVAKYPFLSKLAKYDERNLDNDETRWNLRERNRMFSEVIEDTRLLSCPSFGDQSLVEEREDPSINVILWDDEIDSDEAIIAWESAL